MLELHEILRVSDAVACRIDFILLRDRGRQGEGGGEGGGGVLKLTRNCSVLSIYSRLGCFPQVFGQVTKCLRLKLHKMISILHETACPMDFIFFPMKVDR